MKRVLEVTSPAAAHGTILGEKNGKVVCLPADTKLNRHIFVCGASGTMKSRAIVRNQLFQSIKRGESVVLTDPKAELYDDTAELFRQNGYQVKVFNLVNPEHGDSWNCIGHVPIYLPLTEHMVVVAVRRWQDKAFPCFGAARGLAGVGAAPQSIRCRAAS